MLKFSFLLFLSSSLFAADPVWNEPKVIALEETLTPTPSFVSAQLYLEDAPIGIGAKSAWLIPGGKGENVRIVDVETGLNDQHEDLLQFYLGSVPVKTDHGTSVLGIMGGLDNGFGVLGIAHGAQIGFYGFKEGAQADVDEAYVKGITTAIRESVKQLNAGDVLVIEQQMTGPHASKDTAVEYWPEIFKELKAATDKGIYCVEAAGNGDSDLDDAAYGGAFDVKLRDSGCILVGAGHYDSKKRMYYSNFGSRVDAQGFGNYVTTSGYGDLFNGGENQKYTRSFSGTSSATPIVAGAVALVSSVARNSGKMISPYEMRKALRNTGTLQTENVPDKRIGNLPDIKELLNYFDLSTGHLI